MKAKFLLPVGVIAAGIVFSYLFWTYAVCSHVVGPHEFLVLTSKLGEAKPGRQVLADEGQRGMLRKTLGTGRHFINPIFFDAARKRAVTISATQMGIVTSKDGKDPVNGSLGVTRGERGIWMEVLGPGVYKMNPYAYEIEVRPMTRIPPGHVAVLTHNVTSKVLERTLPAGLHRVNTRVYKVVIVDVGVKHLGFSKHGRSVITEKMLMEDEMPQKIRQMKYPVGGSLGFPSKDGFNVGLDASIVYEIQPKDAVRLISQYGTTDILTRRIIDPALNSVTRNVGSSVTAKEIMQGETRIKFQTLFTQSFLKELKGKPVKAVDALPRGLYVPPKIQLPIMQTTIKQELKLTNFEIEKTTELQNTEEQERKKINLEIEKVKSETEYEVSNISSESTKEVISYEAQTQQLLSKIRLELAKIQAATRLIVSAGEATVITYEGAKKAELLRNKGLALGGMDALVMLNFVESLPEEIPFKVLHSGEGTLWTDLKNLTREQGALMDRVKPRKKK
jgi:hypothetical protein